MRSDPVPDPPPPVTTFQLYRRFIHGLDYIDELVAQVTPNGDRRYVIQDVNHNVRALVNGCTQEIMRQYRYSPYGDFDRNIVGTVKGLEDYDGSTVALDDRESFHGFQGLWSDATLADPATQSTGFYWTRTRIVRPMWERMMQRDPDGQGLTLGSLLAMNGENQRILTDISPWVQYDDGSSLYQGFRSNPITNSDPLGLWADDFDYFLEGDAIIAERQAAAFAAIARFNLIARQTARIAGRFAFQTAITAIVPGAGLYFTAKGLAETIEDMGQRGFTLGNVAMASLDIVGLPAAALQTVKQAKYLRRAWRVFNRKHVEIQLRQRRSAGLGRVEGHHPIPRFLGGTLEQVLAPLEQKLHQQFHRLLNIKLRSKGIPLRVGGHGGSRRDWADYFSAHAGSQEKAFDALLDASEIFDDCYDTSLADLVIKSLEAGSFDVH